MPCCSCIDKLASKLVEHHKIDLIRAYELAEKAVERVENRDVETPIVKSGNPTDYTQYCLPGTCEAYNTCNEGDPCTLSSQCTGSCLKLGSCGCQAPLPNSHLVSNCTVTCLAIGTCARCVGPVGEKYCLPTCTVTNCGAGTCGYDCDVGYVWNGVACVLPVVGEARWDGYYFLDTG